MKFLIYLQKLKFKNMELIDVTVEDKKIMMHNSITSGRFDVTACQLDILFMLLSMIEKNDVENKEYLISAIDVEKITNRQWNYQQLRKSTEDFGSRMFEIETKESLTQLWLWSKVEYYTNTGSFGIVINPFARKYFFELKNNFTVLQLKSVLNCSSKYAKRIYAIACQYKNMRFDPMPLDEFKKMLGLIDKKGVDMYEDVTNFKYKVLDIAKKQINENTDVKFDYKLTKVHSRAFNTIQIYVNKLEPEQLSLFASSVPDFSVNPEIQKKAKAIESYGIRGDLAKIWAVKYWKEFVSEKNNLIELMKQGKIIDDKPAYLVGIFKKKGYN